MKKLTSIPIILIMSFNYLNGQIKFTKMGGGITASTGAHFHNEILTDHKTGNPALTFKGIIEINLPFHISPSATYFLPRVTEQSDGYSKHIISAFQVDINGHYVFNSLDKFEFYALAGLNITFIGSKWKSYGYVDKSRETFPGLNLGVGSYMKLTEQLDFLGEAKYILSPRDQLVFTIGLLLNLEWLSKNENPGL